MIRLKLLKMLRSIISEEMDDGLGKNKKSRKTKKKRSK